MVVSRLFAPRFAEQETPAGYPHPPDKVRNWKLFEMTSVLFPTARRMVLGPPDNIVIHFINKGGYNLESDCQGSDPPIRSVWWIDTEKFGKANVSHQTTMQLKAERLPNTRIHTKT